MAALSTRPGRPGAERNWELEEARRGFGQLTEAVKAQAIEHITLVNAVCHWCGQPLKEPDLGCTRVQAR